MLKPNIKNEVFIHAVRWINVVTWTFSGTKSFLRNFW